MTARFLLHLREWEHLATNMSELSCEWRGTAMMFKKTTVRDDNANDQNQNALGHGHRWTVHDEFGNDPVLEARIGCGVSVNENENENLDINEVEIPSVIIVDTDMEASVASSSTSMPDSMVWWVSGLGKKCIVFSALFYLSIILYFKLYKVPIDEIMHSGKDEVAYRRPRGYFLSWSLWQCQHREYSQN